MIKLVRTNSDNHEFIELVKQLDADLAIRDGDEHVFYAQFNKVDKIKYAVVAYEEEIAVSCGAIKEYDTGIMEVKRMYTRPDYRGKGLAVQVLAQLELWATELACKKCILETGKNQPEAIRIYNKCGYTITPNYGQYAGIDNSVCFEKTL